MADETTTTETPPAPPAPEPTKPMAAAGEASVTSLNMAGSPLPLTAPADPVDYAAQAEEHAKVVQSTVPLLMADEDATALGRTIESRYLPPPPPPSVLEQLAAMKAGPQPEPAPTPPPQPAEPAPVPPPTEPTP